MDDYSQLYKKRFTERRSQSLLNQIRRIVLSNWPPITQVAAIMLLVTIKDHR